MSIQGFDPATATDEAFLAEELRDPVVRLLEGSRIEAGDGFVASVMSRLGAPAWGRRAVSPWLAAAAIVLLLATAAVVLLSGSSEAGVAATSLAAVLDLASSALLAGAGLIGASWSFLSLPARAAFGDSTAASVATLAALLALAFVLRRSLRRRRATAPASAGSDRRER